jgi:DNA-binding NarL/FixJ family response regulator
MSIKRVILANDSRLLLEVFHQALAKAEQLEIVQDVMNNEELPFVIQRHCPDWVIVSLPISDPLLDWIGAFMQNDPSVQFIFLSPDNHSIKIRWQTASEEDISNLSLKEFIYLLEKDLQQI